jgi:hypothetical protein
MSNLSAKFDPNVTQVPRVSHTENIAQAVAYLSGGLLPADLLDASTQTFVYRDALIARIYKEGYAEAVLPTFLRELQTINLVGEPYEISLCEYAATAAYLAGELDLTKEILMRVPASLVTSYINTLYKAIAIKKWGKDMFNTAIGNGADNALQQWEMLQNL